MKKLRAYFIIFTIFIVSACGSNTEKSGVEADSVQAETTSDTIQTNLLVLVPNALEIGLPEGLKETSRTKGNGEDSIFFEPELGINPMDLEFLILKNTDENLRIEQMEEQALFVNDEGKTFEHESNSKYRSQWYLLTYAMEQKFRLTSYKDEGDFSTLVEDVEKKGNTNLKENQTLSAYTNRYFIKLSTTDKGKSKAFVLVLDLIVGC